MKRLFIISFFVFQFFCCSTYCMEILEENDVLEASFAQLDSIAKVLEKNDEDEEVPSLSEVDRLLKETTERLPDLSGRDEEVLLADVRRYQKIVKRVDQFYGEDGSAYESGIAHGKIGLKQEQVAFKVMYLESELKTTEFLLNKDALKEKDQDYNTVLCKSDFPSSQNEFFGEFDTISDSSDEDDRLSLGGVEVLSDDDQENDFEG